MFDTVSNCGSGESSGNSLGVHGPGQFAEGASTRVGRAWGRGASWAVATLHNSWKACRLVTRRVHVCRRVTVRALGPGHGGDDSLTKGGWRQVTTTATPLRAAEGAAVAHVAPAAPAQGRGATMQ